MNQNQTEIIEVMRVVSKIERDIKELDGTEGTLRPIGMSRGRIYERLGIFVVAMFHAKIHPSRVLGLISKMAMMPEDSLDYLTLLGTIQMDNDGVFILPPNLQGLLEC